MEDIDGGLHPAVDGQSLDEMRIWATYPAQRITDSAEKEQNHFMVSEMFQAVCEQLRSLTLPC